MGKGGGCVPSKKRSPIGESDHDLPNPVLDGPIPQNPTPDSTIPIEGLNPSPVSTILVQDGTLQTAVKKRMKKGVDGIDGVEGVLYRVPETLAPEVLDQMKVPSKEGEVPVISPEELVAADGLLFGFPTRYGCMSAQMKAFFRFHREVVGGPEACWSACRVLCEYRHTRRRAGDHCIDCNFSWFS
ncbi:Quinone reductase family protein [Actinidia rufa]|uniref:Quinone reductase family protein n=1 Tax=Actinidia rufa TaxID=165716 RepID=A0A7J0FA25_9ERIC|nr:Quinone reductase family protein [Actinidia rufa]